MMRTRSITAAALAATALGFTASLALPTSVATCPVNFSAYSGGYETN